MAWPSCSRSRSGTRWPSTAIAGPSSASWRTHVICRTSSPSSPPRAQERPTASRFWLTPATARSTPSRNPSVAERTARPHSPGPRLGRRTSRPAPWRCSPWPPSSCSWPRSSPPQASPSSRSGGSASSACSPRSAPRRSICGWCCCGTAPSSARSALRDLARYQARSGAALAAVILALGIAAAVVVSAAAEEKREAERMAAALPNLSDRQIRVYTGPTRDPELIPLPIQTPAQLARSSARVRQLAAGLDGATVIPLRKAIQPGDPPIATFEGDRALVAVGLARQTDPKRWTRGSGLYVATPALLRYLGIDPAAIDPSADFLADPTVPTDELVILSIHARKEFAVTNVQRSDSREVLGSGGAE